MGFLNTLYAKLTAGFLVLVAVLGGAFLYLSQSMNELYSQEIMQRLNQSVAMYVAGQQPLISDGAVNELAMDELASRAMILNPSLEIYILDPQGQILSHRLPEGAVQLTSVSMPPIQEYLSEGAQMPILGPDPRTPEAPNVFSVAAIESTEGDTNTIAGYVYAVIGGELYQSLRSSVMDSYTMRMSGVFIFTGSLIAAIAGCVLFFYLTRRLTRLRTQVDAFGVAQLGHGDHSQQQESPLLSVPLKHESDVKNTDEIDGLDNAFHKMARHINQQFEAIQAMDETRRELIANVSHDLRTPLASMQGYIETLIIKNGSLSEEQRHEYLEIAHKHSRRLSNLVSELFDLAKLESKGIEPKMERFSLLELVHDSAQEFGLVAEKRNIQLDIHGSEDCYVAADIALIHRVLQNLLDNALRHTPNGGKVGIKVERNHEKAVVEVSDTGKGIQTHEIPFIFDRFYQSQQQEPSDKIGTGLGLAIVKRILDLHQSHIAVKSKPNEGTSFVFELPQYS